jgi:hypothetical protein
MKKTLIPKALRIQVWENAYGKSYEGRCYCCQTKIDVHHWHCGHIKAEAKTGKTCASNLRPLCATCNLSAGTTNMNEIRDTFFPRSWCVIV